MSAGYKKKQAAKVQLIPGTCGFCGLDKDDEEVYGKLLHRDNASVHYFCMLFASGLCQNGDSETQGVMGFLIQDIIKEIRRAARLRCVFCKKTGATIGCVVSRCRVVFHLPCGLENGVLNQFTGKFCSYCEEHRPRQSTPCSDRLAFHGTAKSVCSICMASVEARSSNSTIRTPCCKNSWFHKQCLQRHATCSGLHFFRCPLCNNKEIFQDEMLRYGIYIPDQDAAWEQEPDAFNELLERYSRCDTKTCKCPHGRDYSKNDCKWEIMLCDWCGSQGTHLSCGHLKTPMDDWVCAQCTEITGQTATKAKTPKSKNAGKEKTKRTKKEPVDRDWLEKKLAAMKTPTVPTGRGVKRKRDSTTPDDKTRKKRPYKRRNTTPAATATQSAIAASPEACQVRPGDPLHGLEPAVSPPARRTSKYLSRAGGQVDYSNLTDEQLQEYPPWLRRFLHEDIFTGNNVGTKMAQQYSLENSTASTSAGSDPKVPTTEETASASKDGESGKATQVRRSRCRTEDWTEIMQNQNLENKPIWYRSIMSEDFLTGKNLGLKFKKQSMDVRNSITKPTEDKSGLESLNSAEAKTSEVVNTSTNPEDSDTSFRTAPDSLTEMNESVFESSTLDKSATSAVSNTELDTSMPQLTEPLPEEQPSICDVMPILDKISNSLSLNKTSKVSSPKALSSLENKQDRLSNLKTTPKFNKRYSEKSSNFKLKSPSISPKLKSLGRTPLSSYKKIKSSPTIKQKKLDEMSNISTLSGPKSSLLSPSSASKAAKSKKHKLSTPFVTPVSKFSRSPLISAEKTGFRKGLNFSSPKSNSPRNSPRIRSPRIGSPRITSPRTGSPKTAIPRTASPRMSSPASSDWAPLHSPNLADKPRWFCRLMREDIITGSNLGTKLADQFQRDSSPGSVVSPLPLSPQSRDASSSCLGRRTRDWTAEEMLLGYQLRVPVTRMTAGMIRKARRRIKRQAAPKENPPQQASSSVSTLEDNNEKLSYADFVEKHFSLGDARFTSYCDRIMRYQEYLYGPAPLTASGIQIESVWSISNTTSVDETIASSCDEGDMADQSMTGFLRGLQALNRKFTSINSRKPSTVTSGSKETLSEPSTLQSPTSSQTVTSSPQNDRLTSGKNPSAVSTSTSTENASSSSKKSDSSCSENIHSDKSNLITSYFKKPECPPVSTETDLPSKQTPSKPCDVAPSVPPEEAVITLASDDEDQSGTPDAPIVLEGRPDEEEDLFIVSAVVAPKKCTCGKWKQRQKEKNNCAQELHTQTQDTLNKTQDKQNKTQETPKTIAPKDKFASSIDASLDILTIASDSDSQGDIIKLNPGPDKIPTSPLSDSENQQPISDRTRPQAAPNQPINDRTRPQPAPSKPYPKPPLLTPSPELFKPSFQPGKFYKNSPSHQPKYNHSTLQAKYNGQSLQPKYPGPQPVRPASPLATVYSNTTVYKDATQENAYHIQQVQQVNLAPQLQPLGPYAANSCGLNPYPVSSQMLYTYPPTRDCDDITAMSVAYKNQPHAATKCGKCCTCKKK